MDALGATEPERWRAWELLDAPRAISRRREMAAHSTQPVPPPAMPQSGELLRTLRLRRGWTLQQTASHLHVNPATLSRWERSETWPTTEQLHHLCYVLDARPEEQVALEHGRSRLHYDQKPFPSTLPALQDLVHDLEHGHLQVEPGLSDLFFLSLEAHLWRLMQHGKPAGALLIGAYTHHGRCLLNEARLIEAQTPAAHALQLMSRCEQRDQRWLSTIHILAKGAAETGSRFHRLHGVEILRDWLPVAMRLSLTYEAWFLRDIAEYLSQTRSRCEAVHMSEYAVRRGMGIGEDRNVLLSHALVLLNVGRPAEAMEILATTPMLAWDEAQVLQQKVHESVVWARALRGTGQEAEALQWLERARQLVEGHNLWQVSRRVNELLHNLG